MDNKIVSLQCTFIKSMEKESITYTNSDYICNGKNVISLTLEDLIRLCADRQSYSRPPILSQ